MQVWGMQQGAWQTVDSSTRATNGPAGLSPELARLIRNEEHIGLLASFAVGNARWLEVEPSASGLRITQSFTEPSVSPSARNRAAFELRTAWRDHLIATMPSHTQRGSAGQQAAWFSQIQLGRIDDRASWWGEAVGGRQPSAGNPSSFPASGVLAITALGDVYVLMSLDEAASYRTRARQERDGLCNASLQWDEVGGYSNGKRFVPVLSEAQLRRDLPDPGVEVWQTVWRRTPWRRRRRGRRPPNTEVVHSSGETVGRSDSWVNRHKNAQSQAQRLIDWRGRRHRRAAATGSGPAQSRVSAAALPFIEDGLVRRQAFALARPTFRAGSGRSMTMQSSTEMFDWVYCDSPVGHAFYRRHADRVLLPVGTRLYKFNAFLGLIPGSVDDADVDTFKVSPWWSPLDGYAHGSSWEQRGDLAKLVSAMAHHAAQLRTSTTRVGGTTAPIPPDRLNPLTGSLGQVGAGAIVEIGRVTSVVKENWSPLRYILAVELTKPVYAFFGDFAGMERIDLEPEGVDLWAGHTIGEVVRRPAKIATTKANVQRVAGGSALEPTLAGQLARSAAAGARRGRSPGMASGAQLPGGGTQFYIPNFTKEHFTYVSQWPAGASNYVVDGEERGQQIGDQLKVLDLYGADR